MTKPIGKRKQNGNFIRERRASGEETMNPSPWDRRSFLKGVGAMAPVCGIFFDRHLDHGLDGDVGQW